MGRQKVYTESIKRVYIELDQGHEEVREEIRLFLRHLFEKRGALEDDYLVSKDPLRYMLSEGDYGLVQQAFGRRGYRRVSVDGKPLWGGSEPHPKVDLPKAIKSGEVARGVSHQRRLPIPRKVS